MRQSIYDVLSTPLSGILSGSSRNAICATVLNHILKVCGTCDIGDGLACRELFDSLMIRACVDWEYYSGDKLYPIQHPDSNIHQTEYDSNAGYWFYRSESFYTGEYGRRRLELVQRMLDILKTDKE